MKRLLLISVALMLAGCVAYPVYNDGYYYPDYGPYPYGYVGPNVSLYVSNFHGGHGFHGGSHGFHGGSHGFHGGSHGFHGGSHGFGQWGGGRR
jgi:hypothetical protein